MKSSARRETCAWSQQIRKLTCEFADADFLDKALRILKREGLVTSVAGYGVFVAER